MWERSWGREGGVWWKSRLWAEPVFRSQRRGRLRQARGTVWWPSPARHPPSQPRRSSLSSALARRRWSGTDRTPSGCCSSALVSLWLDRAKLWRLLLQLESRCIHRETLVAHMLLWFLGFQSLPQSQGVSKTFCWGVLGFYY